MRIATIVQGEYRTMDSVTKNWNFKEQCDYYVHTWTKSKFRGTDIVFEINEDMIRNNLPNVKAIKLVDFNSVFNVECDQDILTCDIIIYHLINSFKLLIDSGNEYDFVIIARPDTPILFDRPINQFEFKDDRIYGNGTKTFSDNSPITDEIKIKQTESCSDLFYAGDFNTMKKIFESIPLDYLDTHNKDLKTKFPFSSFVLRAGYFIEPLPYLESFGILRYSGTYLNFPNAFPVI